MDTMTVQQQKKIRCNERKDPYLRLVYVIGILLTILGSFVPGTVNWNIVGIALVIFYWIY